MDVFPTISSRAEWMANVDSALDLSTVEPDRFLQRYALVVLYFSTGGEESWTNQAMFLTPDRRECDWFDTSGEGVLSGYHTLALLV